MRVSVVLDCLQPDLLVDFWTTALRYQAVDSPPGYRVLVPGPDEPPGPVLILQRVDAPRQGKNRMHLDVHAPLQLGVPALVEKLVGIGARRIGEPVTELLDTAGVWWQVMADPEGNEFCVVADPGHPGAGA